MLEVHTTEVSIPRERYEQLVAAETKLNVVMATLNMCEMTKDSIKTLMEYTADESKAH